MILYKLFEDNLPSRFIKHVLRSEFIPRFRVIESMDYMVEGRCYLYQGMIIKCVREGQFIHSPLDSLYPSDNLYPINKGVYPDFDSSLYKDLIQGSYKVLKYYDPRDTAASYNYHSKHMWHDSDTHYHLGEYLRYLKAEKGLNLLPYYNCFNQRSTLQLKGSLVKKYLLVPVKFNRTYTIALNSASAVSIKGVLYNDFSGSYQDTNCILNVSNTSFNKPFIVKTGNPIVSETTAEGDRKKVIASYERDLHLMFELDATNESSLVVLEGDYTTLNERVTTSYPHTGSFINLSLLKVDNGVSYAYSGRLIEYLLQHVICEFDTISDNIERVQKQLINLNIKQNDYKLFEDYEESIIRGVSTQGIWDNDLQSKLNIYIHYLLDKGYPLIDQDGNVNTQLEEYLRKGVV